MEVKRPFQNRKIGHLLRLYLKVNFDAVLIQVTRDYALGKLEAGFKRCSPALHAIAVKGDWTCIKARIPCVQRMWLSDFALW